MDFYDYYFVVILLRFSTRGQPPEFRFRRMESFSLILLVQEAEFMEKLIFNSLGTNFPNFVLDHSAVISQFLKNCSQIFSEPIKSKTM